MTESQHQDTQLLASDDDLLRAVRDGDTEAFATLYERHADAAHGLARQLVRQGEVDDIVAETFTRVLSVVQRGGGPADGFRPYLLTALRHVAYDRSRGEKRSVVTDDIERFDSGEPFVDPALEGLERSLIARAFLSLPERWQAVLWHTEIEGRKPAKVAPILGMNANGVAALAYRAREGLRQAYLQMHLADGAPAESCRPALERLGAHVRGGLAKRDAKTVDSHLGDCADCTTVYAELADLNVGLRGIVLPLVVGPAAAAYLKSTGVGMFGGWLWWRRLPKRQKQSALAGSAVAVVVAASALAVVSGEEPVGQEREDPQVAAPPPAAGDDPGGAGGDESEDAGGDESEDAGGDESGDAPADEPEDAPEAQESPPVPGAPPEDTPAVPEAPEGWSPPPDAAADPAPEEAPPEDTPAVPEVPPEDTPAVPEVPPEDTPAVPEVPPEDTPAVPQVPPEDTPAVPEVPEGWSPPSEWPPSDAAADPAPEAAPPENAPVGRGRGQESR